MVREKEGQPAAQRQNNGSHPREEQGEVLPLMRLAPGERFFKFYILTEPGTPPRQRLEHRILTKEHADGTLEMVSYNAWVANGHSEKRDVIRVPSLTKEMLERILERLRREGQVPPESFREIDLSQYPTVEEQLRELAKLGLS